MTIRFRQLQILATLALVFFMGAVGTQAAAQQTAKVLSTCGSASYTAGSTNYVTQDTTGAACGAGGGGGSGSAGVPPAGAANVTPFNVTCGTTATLIAAARTGAQGTGRVSISFEDLGSVVVYYGNSGVTTSTGVPLLTTGASVTIPTTAALYCVVASTTQAISGFEVY